MGNGIINTAVSGLLAFQRSLETTSHNITNSNTEGYSRQNADLVAREPFFTGAGFVGQGVVVSNISRSYDQFLTDQLRSSTSAFSDIQGYNRYAEQIENILADPAIGVSSSMTQFFQALNDATDDPASITTRQVLLSETEILTSNFSTAMGQFSKLRQQINNDIEAKVEQVSTLTQAIADLNVKISSEGTRQLANDLLDERDVYLNQLAEIVDISVVPSDNNRVSVFMGKGQPLVLDSIANGLVTVSSQFDASEPEIGLKLSTGAEINVTSQITGGELTGLLRVRSEVLDSAQQRLGSVAASLALEFNNVHVRGFDLDGNGDGNSGLAYFQGIGSVPVISGFDNSALSSLTVDFDPTQVAEIDHSDYQLDVGTGPSYTLTRLLDNQSFSLTDSGGGVLVATAPDNLPGISITVTSPVDGDSFLIRPTYQAAENIALNLTDPRQVALATNEAIDAAGLPYFINGANTGDNRNGLLLAELENSLIMQGGDVSLQDAYGQIVSHVGSLTHASQLAFSAQETLLINTQTSWSNISSVNLDEEAANLIKFQQAYQASAQMVSASSTLFDSLLGAVQ